MRRLGRSAPRVSVRELLLVLATVLACVAIVLVAGLTLERRYTVSATLAVGQSSIPEAGVTGVRLDRRYYRSTQHADRLVDTSSSWLNVVARSTARRLGDASAASIERHVRVQVPLVLPLLATVTSTAPSPRSAARLTNAFAQEYIRLDRATFFAKVGRAETMASLQLDIAGEANESAARRRRLDRQRETLGVVDAIGPRPITLARPARAQRASRSPQLARDVRVAAVLGLLVGLGLVFFPRALKTGKPRGLKAANA